jgi:cytochrome b involved in lipid metabolism
MNVKKELIVGIIGSAMVIFLTYFYLLQFQNNNAKNNVSTPQTTVTGSQNIILTSDEIAKHNSAGDCWQIINNNVYDVTDYLNQHPAGGGVMIPYCGKDATQAYNTKDGRGNPHSNRANQDLTLLKLGTLNQKMESSSQTIKNNINSIKNSGNPEREVDDD